MLTVIYTYFFFYYISSYCPNLTDQNVALNGSNYPCRSRSHPCSGSIDLLHMEEDLWSTRLHLQRVLHRRLDLLSILHTFYHNRMYTVSWVHKHDTWLIKFPFFCWSICSRRVLCNKSGVNKWTVKRDKLHIKYQIQAAWLLSASKIRWCCKHE